MDQAEQVARLRLIRTRNIGLMTYGLLMRRYGSATDAVAAIPAMAKRSCRHISLASLTSVKAELEMPHSAPEWTDGMRQTIDQTAVDNVRESLLRDLSFDPLTIDDLIGW